MIVLLSPAKSLNFDKKENVAEYSLPRFQEESQMLINKLKRTSKKELKKLMGISPALVDLNAKRYQSFAYPFTEDNAKQALQTFRGDVYLGLQAWKMDRDQLDFAQDHLRILSGLFGLLRPKDLIQPYRLEMGTKLQVRRKKNLYQFWGDKITDSINEEMADKGYETIINLASKEYFSAINTSKLKGHLINVQFKEYRGGELRYIQFNMKRARGLMSRFIIENRIEDAGLLKAFDSEGYHYKEDMSTADDMIFVK